MNILGDTSIIELISTLTVGGVIGSIVGIKSKKRSEAAQASQEEGKALQEAAEADSLKLANTDKLITLYKSALEEFIKRKEESDNEYNSKIKDYELRLSSYEGKLKNYANDLQEKDNLVQESIRLQLKFKLELEQVKSLLLSECEKCEFKSECRKYEAKILLNDKKA